MTFFILVFDRFWTEIHGEDILYGITLPHVTFAMLSVFASQN